MRRKMPIFYSALMLTGVNLLLRMVSTSFQVFLSGRIGAAGVGLLQLVLSVGMLAMTGAMAGIRTTTMYLTAEELGKKRPENVMWVLSGCFGYSIITSGAVAAALYQFAPVVAERWIGDGCAVGAIRILAGFLPVSCLCGVMTGYFTAANRIGMLAAVEVLEQLCSIGTTMLLLVFWAGQDPGRACCAVVLGSGVSSCIALLCLAVLRVREGRSKAPAIPVRGRLLKAAVPLAVADDLKSGISTVENLMVPKRLARYPSSADPLAVFGTVCGMVFPVLMFPAAILFGLTELLIPELARCASAGSNRRIRYLTGRSLRVALLYGLLCGGLLYLLAGDLCLTLYNSREAGRYLQSYALLAPILYCDAVTDAMTKGLGQQKVCVRYNIFTSCMDVVLLYFLLPVWGMKGYFFSFTVTHLINFGLSLRRLLKISRYRLSARMPILAVVSVVLSAWGASCLEAVFARVSAYTLLLGSLLVLFRVVGKEDVLWIKGIIKPKRS